MSISREQLAARLRELRRRHFGPRGKAQLAEKLGVSPETYETYERGTVPPGELLLRICELTGEDLQWLLTGVASRGAVVISGARRRHQDLLVRIAQALDSEPSHARPIEAFLDLLLSSQPTKPPDRGLPGPTEAMDIPILSASQAPEYLDEPLEALPALAGPLQSGRSVPASTALLYEPSLRYFPGSARSAQLIRTVDAERGEFLRSAEILRVFPNAFAVRLEDDSMRPMFEKGDAVVVAPGTVSRVGRPALVKLAGEVGACCRIWLGAHDGVAVLGRLDDGAQESPASDRIRWSLEALFRVVWAA